MAKVIRLTENIAFEFQSTVAHDIFSTGLHLYDFNEARSKQLVNNDSFAYNNRNMSYAPDENGVIMSTTPRPYFPEEVHNANNLANDYPSLTLDYWKCRVQFAAGYGYGRDIWGIVISVSVLVNNSRTVRLLSVFDAKDSSKVTINQRQVILDNIVFNQGFEVQLLDINTLFASTDPQMIELRKDIFGDDATQISEYRIDFAYINNLEAVEFMTDRGQFTRLTPTQTYTQYWSGQVIDDELVAKIQFNDNNSPTAVEVYMHHNRFDIEQYLKRLCKNDGDGFEVYHQLQITAYDVDAGVIGSYTTVTKNPENPFARISIRPFLPANILAQPIDHVHFELRSTFVDAYTGIEVTRYTQLVTENLQIFTSNPIYVNTEEVKLFEKITHTKKVIQVKQENPSIIEIPHNYYFAQPTGTDITLTPFNNTIMIDLGIVVNEPLYMCIGSNKYPQMVRDQSVPATSVTFNIPSTDYYKEDKKYYIVNASDQCVAFGKIERS